jgi:hypothetical protein
LPSPMARPSKGGNSKEKPIPKSMMTTKMLLANEAAAS